MNSELFRSPSLESRSGSAVSTPRFMLLLLVLAATPAARALTLTVLHTFGGLDGQDPLVGLTMDRAGNLYGTTYVGGEHFQGNVFKLTRKNSSWVFQNLYSFQGGADGTDVEGRVAVGPDGTLYGTTRMGGDLQCGYDNSGCGTVFNLRPPPTPCEAVSCPWTKTILYSFTGGNDGIGPSGDLAFDQQDNLYGSAGNVFELSHSGGGWTLTTLSSAVYSYAGVAFDSAGNLYGSDSDTIWQLSPSSSGWVAKTVHTLNPDTEGYTPGGVIFDQAGNLYAATFNGGPNQGGTVFKLSPSGGSWTFSLLYAFTGEGFGGPLYGSLMMDPAGNLYGATFDEGMYNFGSVFRLTPSNGGWTYSDLFDFKSVSPDGSYAVNGLVRDPAGNLYGVTETGGSGNPGEGVVYQITP